MKKIFTSILSLMLCVFSALSLASCNQLKYVKNIKYAGTYEMVQITIEETTIDAPEEMGYFRIILEADGNARIQYDFINFSDVAFAGEEKATWEYEDGKIVLYRVDPDCPSTTTGSSALEWNDGRLMFVVGGGTIICEKEKGNS